MLETDGMLRGGALGRVWIGVDGLEDMGVARGVGRDVDCVGVGRDGACLDCGDEEEKRRPGSGVD